MKVVLDGGASSNYIVSVFFGGKYIANPCSFCFRGSRSLGLSLGRVILLGLSSKVTIRFFSLKTHPTILNIFRLGKFVRFTYTLPS